MEKGNRLIPANAMASALSCSTNFLLVSSLLILLLFFLSHNITSNQSQLIIHSYSYTLSNTFSTNSSSNSSITPLISNILNTNYTTPPKVSLLSFNLSSFVQPNSTGNNQISAKNVSTIRYLTFYE